MNTNPLFTSVYTTPGYTDEEHMYAVGDRLILNPDDERLRNGLGDIEPGQVVTVRALATGRAGHFFSEESEEGIHYEGLFIKAPST